MESTLGFCCIPPKRQVGLDVARRLVSSETALTWPASNEPRRSSPTRHFRPSPPHRSALPKPVVNDKLISCGSEQICQHHQQHRQYLSTTKTISAAALSQSLSRANLGRRDPQLGPREVQMGPQEIQLGPQARQDPPSNQKFCPLPPQRPHLRVANTHSAAVSANSLTTDDAPFPLVADDRRQFYRLDARPRAAACCSDELRRLSQRPSQMMSSGDCRHCFAD